MTDVALILDARAKALRAAAAEAKKGGNDDLAVIYGERADRIEGDIAAMMPNAPIAEKVETQAAAAPTIQKTAK